jgi:hypothetical protein
MLPYGTPKRHFWVHFAFRIPTKSTLGALLVPLFGQFRKERSRKFACRILHRTCSESREDGF